MKLDDWLKANSTPGDLCAPPMSVNDAAEILKAELLGEDWCINYSGNAGQVLTEVVASVVEKYGRKGSKP